MSTSKVVHKLKWFKGFHFFYHIACKPDTNAILDEARSVFWAKVTCSKCLALRK